MKVNIFLLTQHLKQGKVATEDPTVKRLPEMESVVRKANGKLNIAKPLLDVFKHRMLK